MKSKSIFFFVNKKAAKKTLIWNATMLPTPREAEQKFFGSFF